MVHSEPLKTNRVCECGKAKQAVPWTPDQCRLCWLYLNNDEYRRFFDAVKVEGVQRIRLASRVLALGVPPKPRCGQRPFNP